MKSFVSLLLTIIIFLGLYVFLKNPLFNSYVLKQNENKLLKIKGLEEKNYTRFSEFINDFEKQTPWKVYITSTYRSREEQARIKLRDPRNAPAGKSKHNFAKAIDVVLYQNTTWGQIWIEKSSKKDLWLSTKIVEIAKKHNLVWGGNFSRYYDPVHFEVK
jgi:hypothetical protein